MTEQHMRQRVVKLLKSKDAVSVENLVYPGTPDVNYADGWIELKWVRAWPKRGGVLRMPHFTPQQRVFLERRCRRGGKAWLLLQVGQQWLLLTGSVAAKLLGKVTQSELESQATRVWTSTEKMSAELCECF